MSATAENPSAPPREWEPALGERVYHWRHPETIGAVVRCDRFGHFADPSWRVSVRWSEWATEHSIETSNLLREDGTQ